LVVLRERLVLESYLQISRVGVELGYLVEHHGAKHILGCNRCQVSVHGNRKLFRAGKVLGYLGNDIASYLRNESGMIGLILHLVCPLLQR
jgi:hypothetical protein